MKVVILDYGAGNIQSVQFAFERLGIQAKLSKDKEDILYSDKVIFPGVGQASQAMKQLRATGLDVIIPNLEQDVLGICLGMQLMCRYTPEGQTNGLGIFDVDITRFDDTQKVPHIGWNQIEDLSSKLFLGLDSSSYMYAVHSYFVPKCDYTIATSTYGQVFSAALNYRNFYGVQFHPEKSSQGGALVLDNFLKLTT